MFLRKMTAYTHDSSPTAQGTKLPHPIARLVSARTRGICPASEGLCRLDGAKGSPQRPHEPRRGAKGHYEG